MSTDNFYNENRYRYLLYEMWIYSSTHKMFTELVSKGQQSIKDIDFLATSGSLEKHNAIEVEN